MSYAPRIAPLTGISARKVEAVIELLEGGATIPFIARYRKEATGELDEVQIADIQDAWKKMQELDKRREVILQSIAEQGKLSDELRICDYLGRAFAMHFAQVTQWSGLLNKLLLCRLLFCVWRLSLMRLAMTAAVD